MENSVRWSRSETQSIGNSETTTEESKRDAINKKLLALENDKVILTQLYRVHKEKAAETNRSAFRSAYKCNALKVSWL